MKINLRYGILAATTLFILINGCKKKSTDDPMPVTSCETKYEVLFGEAQSTNESATATYQNGQINSLNSSNGNLTYEYLSDYVNVSFSGTPVYRIELTNKLATKITDLTGKEEERMSYDGNRNLIKIETYYDNALTDTKVLAYADGNLTTLTQTFVDSPEAKRVTTYRYSSDIATKSESDHRHLLFGSTNLYIPSFLTGTISRNLLVGSTLINTSDNFRSDYTKDYTYTKNGNGITSKIVENSHAVTISNGVQTQNERTKQTFVISSSCN